METIYSITSDKGDKVYIGRTSKKLYDRKSGHHYDYRNNQYCSSSILFDDYGFDNCVFTALEECAKEQGAERERYYIQNTPNVVNKQLPGRTREEWFEENKEQLKERKKVYTEANKEHKKETDKAYKEANKERIRKEQKEYREANKERIREQQKAYKEANKERLQAYLKAYYQSKKKAS